MVKVPAHEVKKREKENPHHVHEVPVEAAHLDCVVVLAAVGPDEGLPSDHRQEADPDEHMEGVDSGHDEVEKKEEPGMARVDSRNPEPSPRNQVLLVLEVIL